MNLFKKNLVFIGNFYDPRLEDSQEHLVSKDFGERGIPEEGEMVENRKGLQDPLSTDRAYKFVSDFFKDKVIGDPQPPKLSKLTVAELKERNIVGMYENASKSVYISPNEIPKRQYPREVSYENGKISHEDWSDGII